MNAQLGQRWHLLWERPSPSGNPNAGEPGSSANHRRDWGRLDSGHRRFSYDAAGDLLMLGDDDAGAKHIHGLTPCGPR